MAADKRMGAQTVQLPSKPAVAAWASIVGPKEGEGPLGHTFDRVLDDDLLGEKSWEKAEARMLEDAVLTAIDKVNIKRDQVQMLLCGDLLNQIVSASYSARQLGMPYFGVYNACATMSESLLLGAMLIDGGFAGNAVCATCSHFSTAERQYRAPLEMGVQRSPTAQWTVTGSGATVLRAAEVGDSVRVTHGTTGKVVDLGVTEADNMGAAMAPAAADTLLSHLADMGRKPQDYDLIVTGDLGAIGTKLLRELCRRQGTLLENHIDCGNEIFSSEQDAHAGGSGAGCSAVVLNGWLLGRLAQGKLSRVLFAATGALLSPLTTMQGESIPGVCHAVVMERG
jgi:stage V sporulation protein AD